MFIRLQVLLSGRRGQCPSAVTVKTRSGCTPVMTVLRRADELGITAEVALIVRTQLPEDAPSIIRRLYRHHMTGRGSARLSRRAYAAVRAALPNHVSSARSAVDISARFFPSVGRRGHRSPPSGQSLPPRDRR